VSSDFFAHSRLGVAIFGAFVWDSEKAFYKIMLTRVIDKSSAFLVSCYQELLQCASIDINDYEVIHFWSDGPGQYKSRETMASTTFATWKACDRLRLKSIRWHHFCPKHGKGIIDGAFGMMTRVLDVAYKQTDHSTIAQMVSTLSKFADESRILHPEAPTYIFSEWMPEKKGTHARRLWTLSSMSGIDSGYAFSATFTDARRVNLTGRGANYTTCTGVLFTNHGQSGQAGVPIHPTLDLEASLTVEEGLAEVGEADSVLNITTASHAGWRTSFMDDKTNEHEKRIAHLKRSTAALLPPPTDALRHKSRDELEVQFMASQKKSNLRKKEAMAYRKTMRDILG
jgi:hypothetical protein